MQTVLTIAGFDPSSGAGVTADLMVFAAHGLFGTACITALTVQSTLGVRATHPVSAEIVAETLECLDADLPPAGIKIGILGNGSNALRICDYIDKLRVKDSGTVGSFQVPVVLDPVLKATSGRELLDPEGVAVVRERLLPAVDWVTPNREELGVLLGEAVVGRDDVPEACRALQRLVARMAKGRGLGVFATGGDLEPPDDFLLTPDEEGVWVLGERVATRSTHGTGCALSSAFLSRLVLGDAPWEAAAAAKEYVAGALRRAVVIGGGPSPMNHLWRLSKVVD
jgi:hydroxymethylpyrimidine/phosphomethylpyrimidine kinase